MRSRLALAGALTALLLAAVAAIGTTSYAGNDSSSSEAQYDGKVVICHVPEDGPPVTLRVSEQGAKGHLREHPGDAPGPCGV